MIHTCNLDAPNISGFIHGTDLQNSCKQLLTGKNEGDKTEQAAKQPEDETRQDYMWHERFLGVFGTRLSIADHGGEYYLLVVSISYDVDNTCLLWCCQFGIITKFRFFLS